MSKYRVNLMLLMAFLLVVFMGGCGSGTSPTPVIPAAPTVISVAPANAATGVAVGAVISGTFSMAMNPATINGTTFTLTGPGGPVNGGVGSSGSIATFTPSGNLAPATAYTITITTGAQSTAGAGLASAYTAAFTTLDSPFIASTSPVNNAGAVPVTTAVTATFNGAMDSTTLTSATFTLTGPGGAVAGTVTSAGSGATFTPTSSLTASSTYTATITTDVKNVAGNPLLSNYVWTFTTVNPLAVLSTSPLSGTFSVPLNQIISANFNQPLDPNSLTPITFTVTGPGATPVAGTVSGSYAGATANVATFVPTVGLLPNTDYVATLTTGVTSRTGDVMATNYGWNFSTTLPPTVISTVPMDRAIGVPTDQKISATFDQAMNAATLNSPATNFTLTSAAGSVTGAVSYDPVSNTVTLTPAPILSPNTQYTGTITTGAQSALGRNLVNNFVWTFRTGPTADVAPTMIFTNPANLAAGVPTNQKISATFSEAMRPNTINSGTFSLAGPGTTTVAGTVTYDVASNAATFSPTGPLAANINFTATITSGPSGVQDVAGTPMAQNYVWTFTTGAAPDTTAPNVISTNPANSAGNVPTNQKITATLNSSMDSVTINNQTFTLTAGGISVPGDVSYASVSNSAIFAPKSALAASTIYQATITTGAQDLAGNALASNFVWSFTTSANPPVATPPTVTSTNPANNALNVATNQKVNATFSTAMDPLTFNTNTFTVTGPGGASVAGTLAYDAVNNLATFSPVNNLSTTTTYTATITTGVQNLAGTPMAQNYVWNFTTGPVLTAPSTVNLGSAAAFGNFGGAAGMTNQGILTLINGNIGTTGASTSVTGFHDMLGGVYTETPANIGTVNGTIYTCPPPPGGTGNGGTAATCAIATQGASDALAAYNNLAALPAGPDPGAGQLGGLPPLGPGTYTSAGGTFLITGTDLTLDARGDPNAVWVFQMATSLTVGDPSAPRSVILINGAQAKNVFWQVGSAATINAAGGGTMVGTIIAKAGITVSTAANVTTTTLNGRALGLNASVTIVNTVINVPAP